MTTDHLTTGPEAGSEPQQEKKQAATGNQLQPTAAEATTDIPAPEKKHQTERNAQEKGPQTITKSSEAAHTPHPTEDTITNTGTQDQDQQPGIDTVGQKWLQTNTKSDTPAEDPHHGEDEPPPLEDTPPPPVEAWTVANQGDTTHHQGGKTGADPTAPTGSLADTNTGIGPTKTQT